jgi:hypothetical protein
MVASYHWEVIHRGTGIGGAPFGISKAAVETLEGWLGGEALVGPGICRPAIANINETTLLDMITKSINTPKIMSSRT